MRLRTSEQIENWLTGPLARAAGSKSDAMTRALGIPIVAIGVEDLPLLLWIGGCFKEKPELITAAIALSSTDSWW